MERWGVKSFFAKQLFADLWTMICFCVFYIWTDKEPGASLSASEFLKRSIQEFILTRIHLLLQTLHNMLRVCTAYLSNRV